ncbi:tetratricopeptide repeat protein [Planctomycetota bacterium]|nr:tetratricopeptide repeat protein [Planctomycetota bacterium]
MKFISPLLALCLIGLVFSTSTAQDTPPQDPAAKITAQEYAERSKRLREFGYPLLAQTQLNKGLEVDPTDKQLLIEYLRLYNSADGEIVAAFKYLDTLLKLYPDDYTASLEIARLLFQVEALPTPPDTSDPDKLKAGLERLDDEMKVYRELGTFISTPEGDLPKSATGRPRLSLAFLARAEKASPKTFDVAMLTARELDVRGRSFQRWAEISPALKPFGKAAQDLYALALPLFKRASGASHYASESKVQIANLLYRMGRLDDAKTAITGAELLAGNSLRLADTKLAISVDTSDIDLLIEALEQRHSIFNEIYSELDLSVAHRMKANNWPFLRWTEYQSVLQAFGREKTLMAKAVLTNEPKFLEVHYLLADAAMSDSRKAELPQDGISLLRQALTELRACQELSKTLPDWHRMTALISWQLGDFTTAQKAYEATAKADPDDLDAAAYARATADINAELYSAVDYHIYLSQLQPGDFKIKREVLIEVTKRAPKFLAAQQVLGKVCMFIGDFETAYTAYKAAFELDPTIVEVVDGLARSAMEVNRFKESITYFEALQKLKESDDHLRWISLLNDLVGGDDRRRLAFLSWRESTRGTISDTGKKKNLEKALEHDPNFAEACIDLATMVRSKSHDRARSLLEKAKQNARDKYVSGAAHRELGKLYAESRAWAKAVLEFQAAYDAYRADGTDLLLAAMAQLKLKDHSSASACMRKLFAEIPNSPLLRPLPSDLAELDLVPKSGMASKKIHPAYGVGDKISFEGKIAVINEGGGLSGKTEPFEIGVNLQFKETPASGGIWVIDVDFDDVPTEEFKALNELEFTLRISPWFGLAEAPPIGGDLQSVIDPLVQAITEGFTVGLGDLPLQAPQVWKNDLTLGPPHFGGDSAREASALVESLGDNFTLLRRAGAGKRAGDHNSNFTRFLEARVEVGGAQRHLQLVSFDIEKRELTPDRDDVIYSRLTVTLKAK